ncbi:MAG: threonine synthase [Candidatus Bathyarchaeota archaeon]|nr:threonine synthase [Candidatus Bathyarchaeota archaeon]MDH5786735.1 threonine synthase [Candidatus Bathyarchaeota archaeon]
MFTNAAKCSKCGEIYPSNKILTVCTKCGGALLLQCNLALAAETISKKALKKRENTFWKFIEFLPLSSPESIISLCEPYTPVFRLPNSCDTTFKNVYLKDDGRLPTGTFKARGMAVAVSRLKELGVKRVAVPSAGNAAAALAAYGAKAGMEVYAFMPKDASENIVKECIYTGAKVYLVDGLINDAAEVVKRFKEKYGWFDASTNKQPYRFEGYKVMAFEIAEQFNWDPPDTIVFPTGGGEGIIGLWKGFKELIELEWTDKIPRFVVVQSSGCAPIVEAYEKNETEIKEAWKTAQTVASGLRVPKPYAGYLILRAIRETNGMAVAVDDKEIISSMKDFLRMGIYACPEASSTLSSLSKIENAGIVDPHGKILLYLTGNAMKYFDVLALKSEETPVLKKGADPLLTMGARIT